MRILHPDSKLFDETTGTTGEEFERIPVQSSTDMVLTLTEEEALVLANHGEFPPYIPLHLLSDAKRVWIYETGPVHHINFVVRLYQLQPIRMYQMTDPIPRSAITRRRHILPGHVFKAPVFLARDYGHRTFKIW